MCTTRSCSSMMCLHSSNAPCSCIDAAMHTNASTYCIWGRDSKAHSDLLVCNFMQHLNETFDPRFHGGSRPCHACTPHQIRPHCIRRQNSNSACCDKMKCPSSFFLQKTHHPMSCDQNLFTLLLVSVHASQEHIKQLYAHSLKRMQHLNA